MALEMNSALGPITITSPGCIEVRLDDQITQDGQVIATTFRRYVLNPGDSLDNQPARVVAIAQAVWTPEVIQAWQDFLASRQPAAELEQLRA
jgi:hypothetical protein